MPKALFISVGILAVGGALASLVAFGPALWSGAATANPGMNQGDTTGTQPDVPVEVAPVTVGPIEQRRTFSASLEASARVVVAARVAGRVRVVHVDLGDAITRGDAIATLDPSEFEQLVMQARADVTLAKARLSVAENIAVITEREYERLNRLNETGDAPDSERDRAWAEYLSADAAVAVARAQITGAEAALSGAEIRLENATVRAEWDAGDASRVLAERWVEEGDTLSVGAPVATVVEIDPIEAVMFVTESDYASLSIGQRVTLRTDAQPTRVFEGSISRISPVFREGSRQARVEITIANADAALKPGMFARASVVLQREELATIVPAAAISRRNDSDGVFVIAPGTSTARFVPVTVAITQGDMAQVVGPGVDDGLITGEVVTLGQQLLSDNSPVTIPGMTTPDPSRADQASSPLAGAPG